MSLLAAGAAGAYLCSEAFVPGVGVARAQVGMQGDGGRISMCQGRSTPIISI